MFTRGVAQTRRSFSMLYLLLRVSRLLIPLANANISACVAASVSHRHVITRGQNGPSRAPSACGCRCSGDSMNAGRRYNLRCSPVQSDRSTLRLKTLAPVLTVLKHAPFISFQTPSRKAAMPQGQGEARVARRGVASARTCYHCGCCGLQTTLRHTVRRG